MKLAFDIFIDRICNYIGSYYVTLHGKVDALVFAGGIGEKSSKLRATLAEECACLGFRIDSEKNNKPIEGVVQDVGAADSKHGLLVCQTDEQYEMAYGTAQDEKLIALL